MTRKLPLYGIIADCCRTDGPFMNIVNKTDKYSESQCVEQLAIRVYLAERCHGIHISTDITCDRGLFAYPAQAC
jgi:hypothetical protein